MKLIVGLGNPEKQFEETRHNVGYMVIDTIAKKYNSNSAILETFTDKMKIRISHLNNNILLKPADGMNSSGIAVKAICDILEIAHGDVIVVYDDMDFSPGQVKIKPGGGGDGRHNGLKSIINYIGNEFIRIRVGIGKPTSKEDGINFVLEQFPIEEKSRIDKAIAMSVVAVENILEHGLDKAMSMVNAKGVS